MLSKQSKRSTQDLLLERAESLGDFKNFENQIGDLETVGVNEIEEVK